MKQARPERQTGQHHAAAVYAKQVVRGRLKDQCCRYEQLACQRFLDACAARVARRSISDSSSSA